MIKRIKNILARLELAIRVRFNLPRHFARADEEEGVAVGLPHETQSFTNHLFRETDCMAEMICKMLTSLVLDSGLQANAYRFIGFVDHGSGIQAVCFQPVWIEK